MGMSTKTSRFEMRLTESQRDTLETAAGLKGLNLTSWALGNLMDDARRDISESRTLYLSDAAFDRFVSALDDPMPSRTVELLKEAAVWDE